MFSISKLQCLKTLVGWRNHYDITEIPELAPSLNTSDSGVFYQDVHPAMRLDIIKASLPENRTLDSYLDEKINSGIVSAMSMLISEKKYEKYAKQILSSNVAIDAYGWEKDAITNQGRFVGFKIKPTRSIGLNNVLKKIAFQLTQPQTLNLYVFHSSKPTALKIIEINVSGNNGWSWSDQDLVLPSEGLFEGEEIIGGVWIIGYYQSDLVGQAIDYNELDWLVGPCSTCDGGIKIDRWRKMSKFMTMTPFYVPAGSLPAIGEMFDLSIGFDTLRTNYGMNFKVTAECDLSQFFCEHKTTLTRIISLSVVHGILQDIKFSQQINYIEENIKNLIIRDLEGDKDTNYINIVDQLKNEIKAVNFDHSRIGAVCLPCDNNKGVIYDVA